MLPPDSDKTLVKPRVKKVRETDTRGVIAYTMRSYGHAVGMMGAAWWTGYSSRACMILEHLTERDDFFGRIGILDNKIAGVTREMHVLHFTFRARADGDHFNRMDKLVTWVVAAVLARELGFDQDVFGLLPTYILQNRHQFASRPALETQ